jgi:hypothetical protein
MLSAFVSGGLYVRANLPPLPGVYWLAPYPSERSLSDLQREAESAPAYQQALHAAKTARARFVLQALAVWLAAGAALYVLGVVLARSFPRHRHHLSSGSAGTAPH